MDILASDMWHELMFGVGRRRMLLALGLAVLGPIVVTVVLDRFMVPVMLYLVAIIPAAYLGRLWPGLVAAGLSWGAMVAFLRSPGEPLVRQPYDSVALVLFIAVA